MDFQTADAQVEGRFYEPGQARNARQVPGAQEVLARRRHQRLFEHLHRAKKARAPQAGARDQ